LTLLTIIRDELHSDWSYRDIGSVFNVNKGIGHRIQSEAMAEMEHETGRAPLLSADQEAQVIAFITSNFEGGSPFRRNNSSFMCPKHSQYTYRLLGPGDLWGELASEEEQGWLARQRPRHQPMASARDERGIRGSHVFVTFWHHQFCQRVEG
jgi:hypothetical protein